MVGTVTEGEYGEREWACWRTDRSVSLCFLQLEHWLGTLRCQVMVAHGWVRSCAVWLCREQSPASLSVCLIDSTLEAYHNPHPFWEAKTKLLTSDSFTNSWFTLQCLHKVFRQWGHNYNSIHFVAIYKKYQTMIKPIVSKSPDTVHWASWYFYWLLYLT